MNLAQRRLYLVAPAELRAGSLASLIPDLVAAGVDLIQLREKEMEAGDILRVAPPILAACREYDIPFVLNDRPDVALALGADGVHLGDNDLPLMIGRTILPTGLVGLSTHSIEQIDRALEQMPDYIAVGPVHATPTKPGRPGVGIGLIKHAARRIEDVPWFVTGGMNANSLPEILEAGARRIVVVRAIVEADDPVAAAGRIREVLDGAPI